jgi:hypothetical protein
MLDGLDADRGREMRLPRAGAADKDDIVGVFQELAAMELTGERLVDLAASRRSPLARRTDHRSDPHH